MILCSLRQANVVYVSLKYAAASDKLGKTMESVQLCAANANRPDGRIFKRSAALWILLYQNAQLLIQISG